VPELEADGISHRRKRLGAYRSMAREVVAAILASEGVRDWDHLDCTKCPPSAMAQTEQADLVRSVPRS